MIKFTLTYRGQLPSAQGGSHLNVKREMRRVFHEQLKEQWQHEITLARYCTNGFKFIAHDHPDRIGFCEYHVGPFAFVPLVIHAPAMQFVCHLDIELLRRDKPGQIFDGGDLDNRIKILFDALRVPNPNQLQDEAPKPDEVPFFVLLQDDKLITEFSVISKRLLRPPIPPERTDDVELNISVAVDIGDQSPYQGQGRI